MVIMIYILGMIGHAWGGYSSYLIYKGKRSAFIDFIQTNLTYLHYLRKPMLAAMVMNISGIMVLSLEFIRIKMNGDAIWMYVLTIVYVLAHMYKDYIFYNHDWRERQEKIKSYLLFYIILAVLFGIVAYIRFYVLKLSL